MFQTWFSCWEPRQSHCCTAAPSRRDTFLTSTHFAECPAFRFFRDRPVLGRERLTGGGGVSERKRARPKFQVKPSFPCPATTILPLRSTFTPVAVLRKLLPKLVKRVGD